MKKALFFTFAAFALMFFASCADEKDLTGSVDFTYGQRTFHMPVAEFSVEGDRTFVVGTNVSQTISIDFKGNGVNQYTIGYGADSASISIGEGIPNVNLTFVSTVGERDEMVAICGVLTVREYGSDSIVADFSGKGLTPTFADRLINGGYSVEQVASEMKSFSGQFVAVPAKEPKEDGLESSFE